MFGAFWASVEQTASQKAFEMRLSEKNAEIQRKTDQLAAMSLQLAGLVTGGNSTTYVQMAFGKEKNLARLSFWTEGKFPMFDVGARIVDLEIFESLEGEEREVKAIKHLNIGNLRPGPTLGGTYLLPNRDEHRLNIFIQARNGIVLQELRLKWVDTHWAQAHKVTSGQSGEVVAMAVSDSFPKEKLLEEKWDLTRLDEFRHRFGAFFRDSPATQPQNQTASDESAPPVPGS